MRGPPKPPLSTRVKVLAAVGAVATIVGWGLLLTSMALPDWITYEHSANSTRTTVSLWMRCVTTTGQNGTTTTCLGYMTSLKAWAWTLTRTSMLHAFLIAIGGLISFISFLPERSLTILTAGAVCNLVAAGLTFMAMGVFTASILVPMVESVTADGYENARAGDGFYIGWFCTVPMILGGIFGILTATQHDKIVKYKAMKKLNLFMKSKKKVGFVESKKKVGPWGKADLSKLNGNRNGTALTKNFLAPIVDRDRDLAPID